MEFAQKERPIAAAVWPSGKTVDGQTLGYSSCCLTAQPGR